MSSKPAPSGANLMMNRLRRAREAMTGNAETASACVAVAQAALSSASEKHADIEASAGAITEALFNLGDLIGRLVGVSADANKVVNDAHAKTASLANAIHWQAGGEVSPMAKVEILSGQLELITSELSLAMAENTRLAGVIEALKASAERDREQRSVLRINPAESPAGSVERVKLCLSMYGRPAVVRIVGAVGASMMKRLPGELFNVSKDVIDRAVDLVMNVAASLLHDGMSDPSVVAMWKASVGNQTVEGLTRASSAGITDEGVIVSAISDVYSLTSNEKAIASAGRAAASLIEIVGRHCFGIAPEDLPDDVTAGPKSLQSVLANLCLQIAVSTLPPLAYVRPIDLDSPDQIDTVEPMAADVNVTEAATDTVQTPSDAEPVTGDADESSGESPNTSSEPWWSELAEVVFPEAGKTVGKIRFTLDGSGRSHTEVASSIGAITSWLRENHADTLSKASTWKLQTVVNGAVTGFGSL